MFFPPRARLAPGRHHSVTVGGIMLLYPGGFLLPFRVWRSCRAANPANWPRPV
jgi:hypothetical protein